MYRLFLSLLVGALVLVSTPALPYTAPTRSVAQVSYAIKRVRKASARQREAWAKILIRVADKHNFDPLSGWAIIAHESRWRPGAVSADGHDIGLAQIRYTLRGACREDRDSKACERQKQALFDPAVNMAAMAGAITAWRKLCKKVTGKAPLMSQWLQGYGGYSRPKQGIICGHKKVRRKGKVVWVPTKVPKEVRRILQARKRMIRRLRKERIR